MFVSDQAPDPAAAYLTSGRILMSGWAVRTMTVAQLDAVLAHEVAHFAHDDDGVAQVSTTATSRWTPGSTVAAAVTAVATAFAHPLGWIVSVLLLAAVIVAAVTPVMRLRRAAHRIELRCDRTAVALTGDPSALASAMTLMDRRAGLCWRWRPWGSSTHPATPARVRVFSRTGRLWDVTPRRA